MTQSEEDALALMWAEGESIGAMAHKIGYSENYIRRYMMTHRSKFPYRKRRVTRQQQELWVARINSGRFTKAEVAEKLGVSYVTVSKWIAENARSDDET